MAPTSTSSRVKHRAQIAYILFQSRLHRAGKLVQFLTDRATNSCRRTELRKKYGFVSAKDELERFEALKHESLFNRRKSQMEESRRNKGRSGLDKAFDALPNKASADQEVSWVQSHPKMRRALHEILRGDEERSPPKITAADITSPSNGPCPSKTAFNMLLSWLANPKEFQKQMLSKQRDVVTKDGGSGEANSNGKVSDDTSGLERLLEQYQDINGG